VWLSLKEHTGERRSQCASEEYVSTLVSKQIALLSLGIDNLGLIKGQRKGEDDQVRSVL